MFRGELKRAVQLGREAVEMAQGTKLLRLARAGLGRTMLHMGEFRQSVDNLERALSLPESQSLGLYGSHSFHYASRPSLLNFLCNSLWFLGFPDQAMRRSREALQLARASRNFPLLAVMLIFLADFYIRYGEEDRFAECIEKFAAVVAELEATAIVPQLMEIRKGRLNRHNSQWHRRPSRGRLQVSRLIPSRTPGARLRACQPV
jgi:adenylate cyclase